MNAITCHTCGSPFITRRAGNRFCSADCRRTWHTAMQRGERLRRTGEAMIRAGDRLLERADQLDGPEPPRAA